MLAHAQTDEAGDAAGMSDIPDSPERSCPAVTCLFTG